MLLWGMQLILLREFPRYEKFVCVEDTVYCIANQLFRQVVFGNLCLSLGINALSIACSQGKLVVLTAKWIEILQFKFCQSHFHFNPYIPEFAEEYVPGSSKAQVAIEKMPKAITIFSIWFVKMPCNFIQA